MIIAKLNLITLGGNSMIDKIKEYLYLKDMVVSSFLGDGTMLGCSCGCGGDAITLEEWEQEAINIGNAESRLSELEKEVSNIEDISNLYIETLGEGWVNGWNDALDSVIGFSKRKLYPHQENRDIVKFCESKLRRK